jgi:glycosyltransferase involved in cell wall biosynthesis
MGVDPQESMVVRNWTHVSPLPASSDRAAFRRQMGWSEDETVLLHTGNMGAKQDLGNLVEVARLADRDDLPVRVVLMGDGNMRQAVEHDASGVQRVQFLPPVDASDYMTALTAADVLLVNEHPAMRSMALPSKLTSYFAAGQPVIAATNADSLTAQELDAAGAGIRVDPAQPEALLAAAMSLRGSPDEAQALGERGRLYQSSVLTERSSMRLLFRWIHDLRSTPQLARGHERLAA